MSILSKYVANATLINRQSQYTCECLEFAVIFQENGENAGQVQQTDQERSLKSAQKEGSRFRLNAFAPLSQLIRSSVAMLSQ